MKQSIFIKILCLLICFSLLTPTVATAARPKGFTDGTYFIYYEKHTNEMEYVNQFFNHDGSYTDTGNALLHWLDMSPRTETGTRATGGSRRHSGYLMLEQEMEHQDDSFLYWKSEVFGKFIQPIAEFIGTGSASAWIDVLSNEGFKDKFPEAGEDAYVYYNLLCQIYLEYANQLQKDMVEISEAWNKLFTSSGNIYKLSSNFLSVLPEDTDIPTETIKTSTLVEETEMLCTQIVSTDTWSFDFGKGGSRTKYKVYNFGNNVDVDKGANQQMRFVIQGKNHVEEATLEELVQRHKNNNNFELEFTDFADPNVLPDEIHDLMTQKIEAVSSGRYDLRNMSTEHVIRYTEVIQESNVDESVRDAAKTVENALDDAEKPKIRMPGFVDELGDVIDAAGVTVDVMGAVAGIGSYVSQKDMLTAQQISYLSALTTVTQEYLDMISQWKNKVDVSIPEKDKPAVQDALAAFWIDIVCVYDRTQEQIIEAAKEDAFDFSGKALFNMVADIVDAGCSVGGLVSAANSAKTASDLAQTASTVTSVAAMLSTALSIAGADFMEFDKNSNAIFNLKKSLCNLLTNPTNGLLAQYAKYPNHRTACEIISALETMKSAKIIGENIWEEYYLMDFYKSQDVEPGGAVHLVLRNELAQRRTGSKELDGRGSFVTVIGVYEDIINSGSVLQAPTVETVVLGYYLRYPNNSISYQGRSLTVLPSYFSLLDYYPPDHPLFAKNIGSRISEKWLNGQIDTGNLSEMMYKNEYMHLYSKNGFEVVLTDEEYSQYHKLEKQANELLKSANTDTIDYRIGSKKEAQQAQRRMEWTNITRQWIDSFEMYQSSKDYKKDKIKYIAVP